MKLLLDTHTFIWWDNEPQRLSQSHFGALSDSSNTLFLSVVSAWEMQVKSQIGKLKLDRSLKEIIEQQRHINNLELLPVTFEHVLGLQDLPLHHKDPFDRLLIAQAIVEDVTLVSIDPMFGKYPVSLLP